MDDGRGGEFCRILPAILNESNPCPRDRRDSGSIKREQGRARNPYLRTPAHPFPPASASGVELPGATVAVWQGPCLGVDRSCHVL
jgi:hypothetical protein